MGSDIYALADADNKTINKSLKFYLKNSHKGQ